MTENCPPPPIGGPNGQTDLNAPVTPDQVTAFTQIHMGQLSDLCQWGLSGSIITSLLMQFMRNHFSSADTIMMPSLKGLVYNPANNGVGSGIRIVNFADFDPNSGQQPSIVVRRGGKTSDRKIMDDRNQTSVPAQNEGFTNYVRFITGSHTLYATSTVLGGVEDLGDEIFDSLTFMSPVFRSLLPFHDFQVTAETEAGVMDDLGNILGVEITVNYTYEYGWTVQPKAPRIKTFGILAS